MHGASPLRSTGARRQHVHQFALRMRLLAPFLARRNMEKVKVSTVACPIQQTSKSQNFVCSRHLKKMGFAMLEIIHNAGTSITIITYHCERSLTVNHNHVYCLHVSARDCVCLGLLMVSYLKSSRVRFLAYLSTSPVCDPQFSPMFGCELSLESRHVRLPTKEGWLSSRLWTRRECLLHSTGL